MQTRKVVDPCHHFGLWRDIGLFTHSEIPFAAMLRDAIVVELKIKDRLGCQFGVFGNKGLDHWQIVFVAEIKITRWSCAGQPKIAPVP